jgi:ubiquinone/menaquinone biosynthesis C-methylase UbiE
MGSLRKIYMLSGTGFSFGNYYESVNWALRRANNQFTMLHYPFYVNESDNFIQSQQNLTDYCVSLLGPLTNKNILEIGCGNGVQSLYLSTNYNPSSVTGVDLNESNIRIANQERDRLKLDNVHFLTGDAQNLEQIPSNSIDVVFNIESALHYPDKSAFLREINRVLKPGGQFLIADILSTTKKKKGFLNLLDKRMVHHFWNRDIYESEFSNTNLAISHHEDITQQIIKGFGIYRNWLPKMKTKSFILDIAFRIFYIIHVKLNVYSLKHKQQYYVFVGNKPLSQQSARKAGMSVGATEVN